MENNLMAKIQEVNDTQRAINRWENENRATMCSVIIEILKETGGKLTSDDWKGTLGEGDGEDYLYMIFISEDGTYINNYCEVKSIELFEMRNGTPNFKINCEDTDELPEYALSYDNVCQIFEGLSEFWQSKQR